MNKLKSEVSAQMKRIREGRLRSSGEIVEEAFRDVGFSKETIDSYAVRRNFNDLLFKVWKQTLVVLEHYENSAYSEGIPRELIKNSRFSFEKAKNLLHKGGFEEAVIYLFKDWYPYLREMFLSVSQSRKTRGGTDFELQIGKLFDLANIPFQKIQRKYRVDFMIPNDETFKHNPTAAAIASLKRTLRERWREVVEELQAMRSPNIFLLTADEKITSGHVKQICNNYKIQLIVWQHIKTKKFKDNPLVLDYNTWAAERIPILEKFW